MGKSDSQTRYEDYLVEQLKDPALKAEYDALDPEFEEIKGKIEREKVLKAAIEEGTMPETDYPKRNFGKRQQRQKRKSRAARTPCSIQSTPS